MMSPFLPKDENQPSHIMFLFNCKITDETLLTSMFKGFHLFNSQL